MVNIKKNYLKKSARSTVKGNKKELENLECHH